MRAVASTKFNVFTTPKSCVHKNSSKEIYLHFNDKLLKLCTCCIMNANCLFVKFKQFSIYTS